MKLRTIATVAALAFMAHATSSHATGSKPSTPAPTPAPPAATPVYVGGPTSASADSSSSAGAASNSGARSAATGGLATAAGGAGGTAAAAAGDSNAASTNTMQDSSNFWSSSRALGLSFAPGAFTPPMAPVQCASATITQSARGLGMGILSRADSKTDSSDCTLIQMRNAAVAACKFETAKKIEDGLVKKHLPDFEPSSTTYLKDNNDPGYVDYSPTQCALLTSPPPKPVDPVTLNWIYVPPPAARVEDKPAESPPAAATPPAAPPAKPRKPINPSKSISTRPMTPAKPTTPGTTLNCGENGTPMCVAKPRKPLALSGGQEGRS